MLSPENTRFEFSDADFPIENGSRADAVRYENLKVEMSSPEGIALHKHIQRILNRAYLLNGGSRAVEQEDRDIFNSRIWWDKAHRISAEIITRDGLKRQSSGVALQYDISDNMGEKMTGVAQVLKGDINTTLITLSAESSQLRTTTSLLVLPSNWAQEEDVSEFLVLPWDRFASFTNGRVASAGTDILQSPVSVKDISSIQNGVAFMFSRPLYPDSPLDPLIYEMYGEIGETSLGAGQDVQMFMSTGAMESIVSISPEDNSGQLFTSKV